jgi:CheY-like chemotaxis protein
MRKLFPMKSTMKEFSILQVEDDENDAVLMQLAFHEIGIPNRLVRVRDGQETIDYLGGVGKYANRDLFPVPCLVLLDLKLPRRSGLDVLKWIRGHPVLKTLIVIIFSSSPQPEDIDRAYEAGVNSFLVKPTGIQELLGLLEALKTYWLNHNELPSACIPVLFEAS